MLSPSLVRFLEKRKNTGGAFFLLQGAKRFWCSGIYALIYYFWIALAFFFHCKSPNKTCGAFISNIE